MTDIRDGIASVVAAAEPGAGVRETLREPETGDLFAPPTPAGDEALPLATRRPGRPPGSRNRRTTEVAAYLVGRYGDPLEGLMAIGMGSLAETARAMHDAMLELRAEGVPVCNSKGELLVGIDLNEVMKLKTKALEAALPYIHARRAPTDEKGESVVPILNITGLAAGHAQGGSGVSIEDFIDVTPNPPSA